MRSRIRSLAESERYSAYEELWRRTNYLASGKGDPFLVGLASPRTNNIPQPPGREKTSDENHKIHNTSKLRGSMGDQGGEFSNEKWGRSYDATPRILATNWGLESTTYDKMYRYIGPVFAINPGSVPVDLSSSLRRNLKPLGTTAISRCKPTNHISDLAADLFEIYHGQLPKLPGRSTWESQAHKLHSVGDEYLNSEFGWKPLVSDIRDASYAAANSARLMKSYEENSGKTVRRSYEFPVEETVDAIDLGPSDGYTVYTNSWSGSYIDSTRSQPHLLKVTKFRRRTWFKGSFTYYLPVEYKSRKKLARIAAQAEHLYGIELTPYTLWELSPWTWAVDWFSNTGDVLNNLTSWSADGLVLNYGYLMEHIVSEVTYALDRPSRYKLLGGGYAPCSPVTAYYESKQRIRATPFGFEIDWKALSPRQLAITVGLGLTRFF